MSELTPNLGLFKYNTTTDGKETFSINTALNDNWDILDNVMTFTSYLGESGYTKFSNGMLINYGNASTGTQEVSFLRPTLTSDGVLGGDTFAVAANGIYNKWYAYLACDGVTTNQWRVTLSGTAWFTFYNPSPLKVTQLSIQNPSGYKIKDYYVTASNDNTQWTQLTSGQNTNTSNYGTWYISLADNTNFYKYYRISATSCYTNGGQYVGIVELGITATYITTATNSVTFPCAHSNNKYAYSLAYLNGPIQNSCALTQTTTGLTLQNNSTANTVYYMTVGY